MRLNQNEKGVTLVEVLAAVVILSIILFSIMNFFPQMGVVTKTNSDKSQALNSAKMVLNKWEKDEDVRIFLKSGGTGVFSSDLGTKLDDVTFSDGIYYHFRSTEGNFQADIYIKKELDLGNITDSSAKEELIKVQLSNNKGTVITETYGYINFT